MQEAIIVVYICAFDVFFTYDVVSAARPSELGPAGPS